MSRKWFYRLARECITRASGKMMSLIVVDPQMVEWQERTDGHRFQQEFRI
jgi:hypothetical protein